MRCSRQIKSTLAREGNQTYRTVTKCDGLAQHSARTPFLVPPRGGVYLIYLADRDESIKRHRRCSSQLQSRDRSIRQHESLARSSRSTRRYQPCGCSSIINGRRVVRIFFEPPQSQRAYVINGQIGKRPKAGLSLRLLVFRGAISVIIIIRFVDR